MADEGNTEVRHSWNDSDIGNPITEKKNRSQYQVILHRFYTGWSGNKSGTPQKSNSVSRSTNIQAG